MHEIERDEYEDREQNRRKPRAPAHWTGDAVLAMAHAALDELLGEAPRPVPAEEALHRGGEEKHVALEAHSLRSVVSARQDGWCEGGVS